MVKNSNNINVIIWSSISFFFVQVVSPMYSILVVIFTVSVIDLSISDLKVSLLFEFHENWWKRRLILLLFVLFQVVCIQITWNFIWNRHDHDCQSVIAIIFFKKSLDCHHHWVIDNQMICCPIRKMNSAISLYFSYSIKQ